MTDEERIEARRRGAAIQPGVADQSNRRNQSDQNNRMADSPAPMTTDTIRERLEGDKANRANATNGANTGAAAPSGTAVAATAGGGTIAGAVAPAPVSEEHIAAARQTVSDGDDRQRRWQAMMERLGVEPPETEEARKKREKREKWARISAALGDGISAFANLWSTTQYGPNVKMVSASDRLGEQYRREKEERDKNKDAYFRAWQWFDKREREEAAAKAKAAADEADRQLKEREQRRKENKDKEDGRRANRKLEHEIEMGRAKNAREEHKDKREQELHPLRMSKTQAETARAKAQTVNAYAQARKASASTKSQPDIKLPNGKIIHSESEAEFKKNAKRIAKLYDIDTFTRDANGYREKSAAELAAEIESIRDHEATLKYNQKEGDGTSLEEYYDALIESGFGTDLTAKQFREVLASNGRKSLYDELRRQGVPMPMRADEHGKLTEDFSAWSNMMDQMMGGAGGNGANGTNGTNGTNTEAAGAGGAQLRTVAAVNAATAGADTIKANRSNKTNTTNGANTQAAKPSNAAGAEAGRTAPTPKRQAAPAKETAPAGAESDSAKAEDKPKMSNTAGLLEGAFGRRKPPYR